MIKKIIFGILILLFYGFSRQESIKPIEHEVKVELVLIEVFVTDKKGNFIDDLTINDFEIYEDGRRVPIQYFNLVKTLRKENEKKEETRDVSSPPLREKRLAVIFDSINTNPIFLFRAMPEIERMLKSLSERAKEIAIIELNQKYGMRVIQPFSSVKSFNLKRLSEFKGEIFKYLEKSYSEKSIEEITMLETAEFTSNPKLLMDAIEMDKKLIIRRRLELSLSPLLNALNYLRSFEGIKVVLFISDGFYMERGELKLPDPFNFFGRGKYFDSYESLNFLLKLLNEEDITFYTLSPKGMHLVAEPKETPWPTALEHPEVSKTIWKDEMEQWERELFTIEKIAEETGGVYLREAGKYEDFVRHFERDLTHFYEIAYKPPRELNDGKYHKIEIRVKRPDVIVRYKKGYMDFNEKELEKRNLASAFLSPSFFKDIEFSCDMDLFPSADGNYQFWTRLRIPLNQFEKIETPPDELTLTFGLKEEEKFHMGETKLRLKEALQRKAPFIYFSFGTSPLKLKPREYQALVILRRGGEKIGGWEKSLKIPEMKKEPLIINSVLGNIRSDRQSDDAQFSISKKDGALNLSKYKFYPLVENELKEGSQLALFLQIYNPDKLKDFPFEFPLYKEEKLISNVPFEKVESYFGRESKILNEIFLLNFNGISADQYKLTIHSPQIPIEKAIEIKILPSK